MQQWGPRMADTSESRDLITIQELSRRSGVSVSTLRRYARRGTIEALQPGGPRCMLLFRPDALASAKATSSGASEPTSETPRKGPLPGHRPKWMTSNLVENDAAT